MNRLTIAAIIGLLSITRSVMAQDSVNWAAHPSSTKSWTITAWGSNSRDPSVVFDNNDETSYTEDYDTSSTNNSETNTIESDFSIPRTINQLKIICSATWVTSIHNMEVSNSNNYTLEAFYDGIWQVVGSGSLSRGELTTIDFPGLMLENVSKVKFSVVARGTFLGSPLVTFTFTAYELYAYGPDYVDIGMRCGNTVIACHPSGELLSPVRVYKNGTTYTIALVNTDNINASKIRIQTQNGVKSLAKFN